MKTFMDVAPSLASMIVPDLRPGQKPFLLHTKMDKPGLAREVVWQGSIGSTVQVRASELVAALYKMPRMARLIHYRYSSLVFLICWFIHWEVLEDFWQILGRFQGVGLVGFGRFW